MNYTTNSHNRKLKHRIHILIDRLSFNFLNLSGGYKICLLGMIFVVVSFFFSWMLLPGENGPTALTAFNVHAGYFGWLALPILASLGLILLSNVNREKLKSKTKIFFPDHTIIIFTGVVFFLLSFVILNTVRGDSMLIQGITTGRGIIFAFL